jgi:aminoglycoside phosphotransferase (APT) family kinase protein
MPPAILEQYPDIMSTGNIPPRAYRSAKAAQLLAKRAQLTDDSIYVKHGTSQEIQREIEAINFVRQHTSVPVPSVVETFIDENPTAETSWFSMKEIPGSSLATAWAIMTPIARSKTKADLQNYLLEMRNIPPRNPFCIGSCSGGPAYDHRFNNGFPCGPFASESDFNDYLVALVAKCPKKELVSYYRQQMADDHGIAFTHADLDGDHILVDPATGRINGIIDWEMAGWWPKYWEYTKSMFGSRY